MQMLYYHTKLWGDGRNGECLSSYRCIGTDLTYSVTITYISRFHRQVLSLRVDCRVFADMTSVVHTNNLKVIYANYIFVYNEKLHAKIKMQ